MTALLSTAYTRMSVSSWEKLLLIIISLSSIAVLGHINWQYTEMQSEWLLKGVRGILTGYDLIQVQHTH